MKSVVSFIERRMKLKVNAEKTKIVPPNGLTYLGYSFYKDNERWRARASEEKFSSLKSKVRILTKRSDPTTTQEICKRITRLFRGWINYFQLADMKGYMEKLWQWVKGRIRVIIYKKWKKPKKREEALLKCWEIRKRMENLQGWKISERRMRNNARGMANQGNHYAKIAKSATFAHFVSDFLLEKKGLLNPLKYYLERRKSLC